uniref:Acyltransferase n=1 Tax=Equus asinus asinus TaxID=83772 RepID=A0A8C4MFG9_EQUAS
GAGSPRPPRSSTMNTLQKQWLEAVRTYQHVFVLLFVVPLFSLLVLFTSLWWLSVLYLVGLFLGWDTPSQGGRPSEWMRKQTFWKHLSDYSPIKETVELPPNWNYVLGAHPHGIMCTGIFCNFLTESNGFSQRLHGHRPWTATLDSLFRLPVYHGYIMSLGMCPGNHQGLDFILSQPQLGQAVVIIVGGAHECLSMVPGEHHLTLQEQKGFLHLALRHGAALVSVYSFGENGIFSLKTFATGSWQHLCQITFKKLLGFAPCVFWGRGLFSATSWGLLPFAVPITTVGERLSPHLCHPVLQWAAPLFEEHRASCGVAPLLTSPSSSLALCHLPHGATEPLIPCTLTSTYCHTLLLQ